MSNELKRGSEKVLKAWKARALTEEGVKEIAEGLGASKGKVETAQVIAGNAGHGLKVQLTYAGEDIEYCGNDIRFWLKWHLKNGGIVRPPRILINGTPIPEFLTMHLDFGNVDGVRQTELADAVRTAGGVIVTDGSRIRE